MLLPLTQAVTLMTLSMTPLHLLGKMMEMCRNMTFFSAMWHNCHCHHMMPFVLVSHNAYNIINETIIFLGQDDRAEMPHDFLGHMMPLALALSLTACVANNIVNDTIAVLSSRWSEWSATWLFWSCDTIRRSTSHDADGIINSTIRFLKSRWSKWGAK